MPVFQSACAEESPSSSPAPIPLPSPEPARSSRQTEAPKPLDDRLPFPVPGAKFPLGSSAATTVVSPLASLSTGIELNSESIANSPFRGLLALKVSVKNNTDRPLNFEGDETTLSLGELKLKAAAMQEIENRIMEPDNPHGYKMRSLENAATAAVTIGAVQTVEGQLKLVGPIANRYGWDNLRRSDLQARFAKRVLWPGDSSEGTIYFKTNKSLAGASIQMPVSSFYDKTDKTTAISTVR